MTASVLPSAQERQKEKPQSPAAIQDDALTVAAKDRRARRREWADVPDEEFDHRYTRRGFKYAKVNISMPRDLLARVDAERLKMDHGLGKTRSGYIAWVLAQRFKHQSREWMTRE